MDIFLLEPLLREKNIKIAISGAFSGETSVVSTLRRARPGRAQSQSSLVYRLILVIMSAEMTSNRDNTCKLDAKSLQETLNEHLIAKPYVKTGLSQSIIYCALWKCTSHSVILLCGTV